MKDFQAVFIDRDGTIGGTGHFVHPSNFKQYEGAQEAINRLKQAGYKVFAFTNQHRISRSEATIEEPDYIAEHINDAVDWILNT